MADATIATGGHRCRSRRSSLATVPAAVPLPAATAARLSTRLVTLSGVETAEVQSMLHAHEARADGVRLSLPPSAFLGQPVRAGHRVAPKSLMLPGGAETIGEAFKPDWASLVYHPKLSARRRPRLLRGADGRKVIPLDNQSFIYGSDDRAVFYPSGYPWHCIGKVDVFPSATAEIADDMGQRRADRRSRRAHGGPRTAGQSTVGAVEDALHGGPLQRIAGGWSRCRLLCVRLQRISRRRVGNRLRGASALRAAWCRPGVFRLEEL